MCQAGGCVSGWPLMGPVSMSQWCSCALNHEYTYTDLIFYKEPEQRSFFLKRPCVQEETCINPSFADTLDSMVWNQQETWKELAFWLHYICSQGAKLSGVGPEWSSLDTSQCHRGQYRSLSNQEKWAFADGYSVMNDLHRSWTLSQEWQDTITDLTPHLEHVNSGNSGNTWETMVCLEMLAWIWAACPGLLMISGVIVKVVTAVLTAAYRLGFSSFHYQAHPAFRLSGI